MSGDPRSHETTLRIASDHPALPGHFPGRPISPGVLLLDLALEQGERWLGRPLTVDSLVQAKFVSPLLPEQDAQLHLTLTDNDLRFTITREGASIAQGLFRLSAGRTP